MDTKADRFYSGPVCATLAFLGSFLFFQFAYPYHLMRREQLDLFLYDGGYIAERAGWPVSRVISWSSSASCLLSGRWWWRSS